MRVYITAAADEVAMKPKAEPPQPQQQQQAAARRGCRSAVVTGLLAGVLFLRAALLAAPTAALRGAPTSPKRCLPRAPHHLPEAPLPTA